MNSNPDKNPDKVLGFLSPPHIPNGHKQVGFYPMGKSRPITKLCSAVRAAPLNGVLPVKFPPGMHFPQP